MATVSTKIEVEGARQFKKDFSDASLAVKSASSELKYFSTELDRSGRSTENYAKAQKSLEKAMTAEGNAIKLLEDRIAALQHEGGESAERQITKLTGELYKHKNAQADLQHQMDTLGDQAEETGNQFGENFAQDVATATVFLDKAVDLAIDLGKKILDIGKGAVQYNAKMEGYEKTIEAFFKTSGQSAEEASKNTKDLIANQKALAAQIGIGTDTLLDANKMLIASGVEGDKAQEAIAALAKAIVATGGGKEELSRMAQNLQQISNTGKASTQDLKQFAMAGIDVYGLLADSTGKSVDELKEMDITFDDIVSALGSATTEGGKFFEASQTGATTLNGQINILKQDIEEGLGVAFEPVNQALEDNLLPLAKQLVEDIDWESIGKGIADGITALTELMQKIDEVVAWIEEQQMSEKGKAFVDDFASGMHDNNGAMNVAASYLMDSFYADVAEEKAKATLVGTDITDSVAEGMKSGKSGVIGAAEEVEMSAFAVWNENNQAEQYGMDFVAGFASGMHKNNGLISNAAAQIAEIIKSWLHFSRPDIGPLRDYENWMPDFVSGLAKTMKQSEWMMADAASDLAQTITNNSVTNTYNMTINGSPGQSVNDLADAVMIRIQQATDRRSAVWA